MQNMRLLRWAGLWTIACGLFCYCRRRVFGQQTSPESAAASTVKKLPPVHLDGQYFTRDGKRFLPVGAHWVPAKAAMQWPVQWDPKDIEADFAKMHELGYSIVRFDMMWAWFEPRPATTTRLHFSNSITSFRSRTNIRSTCTRPYL